MIFLLQPIVDRLVEVFGEDIPIYTDKKEQGVIRPCFFVSLSNAELVGGFDNLYDFKNIVTIVYMNDDDDAYTLEAVRFNMLTGLERIKTERGACAVSLEAKKIDKDIVLVAQYNLRVERVKIPDPLMMKLKQDGGIKER